MQANNVTWYMNNPLLLDIVAPIDHADPSALVVVDAADVSVYVLDKVAKTVTTAAGATVTVIPIQKDVFAAGDVLYIEDEAAEFFKVTVSDASTVGEVTVTPACSFSIGGRVWKAYGDSASYASIDVSGEYGTAALTSSNWGYVVEIPYTYDSRLRRDLTLEVYAVLTKTGTGARYTRAWDVIMAEPRGAP